MAVLVNVAGSGGDVYFEVDSSAGDLREIGVGDKAKDIVKDAAVAYDTVATVIQRCATDVLRTIDAMVANESDDRRLSTVELEIGVKVTAEGNVIVAKGTAEANLKLLMTWTRT